jgi:hypothetical protein
MAPSGATTTPNNSSANGSKIVNGNGAIGSGGTIGGGGVGACTSTQGPLLIFNPIVQFFNQLWQIYQRVGIEKLRSL